MPTGQFQSLFVGEGAILPVRIGLIGPVRLLLAEPGPGKLSLLNKYPTISDLELAMKASTHSSIPTLVSIAANGSIGIVIIVVA